MTLLVNASQTVYKLSVILMESYEMAKVQTSLRIDEKPLTEAKAILAGLGMNFTEAVNIFTNLVVQHRGLPFEVRIPNAETKQVIEEARRGENVSEFSLDELKQ